MSRRTKEDFDVQLDLEQAALAKSRANVVELPQKKNRDPLDWEWVDKAGVPRKHGLEEFRDGNPDLGIVGNPFLIHDLAPALKKRFTNKSLNTVTFYRASLRDVWRAIPSADAARATAKPARPPITRREHIGKALGDQIFAQVAASGLSARGVHRKWRYILSLVHAIVGDEAIKDWPHIRKPRDTEAHPDVCPVATKALLVVFKSELAEDRRRHRAGRRILAELTNRPAAIELTPEHMGVKGVFARKSAIWDDPWNLLLTLSRRPFRLLASGAYANENGYRETLRKSLKRNAEALAEITGLPHLRGVADFESLFVPGFNAAGAGLFITMFRNGWTDAARAIDVSSDGWKAPGRTLEYQKTTIRKDPNTGHYVPVMKSIIKEEMEIVSVEVGYPDEPDAPATEGGTTQITSHRPKTGYPVSKPSLVEGPDGTGVYAVIRYFVERTAPLRAVLVAQREALEASATKTSETVREIARLSELIRCPWLYASKLGTLDGFSPGGYSQIRLDTFNVFKKRAVARVDRDLTRIEVHSEGREARIDEIRALIEAIDRFTPSDARDALAGFVLGRTGSIWAVKGELGHRWLDSSFRYVRQRFQIRNNLMDAARVMESACDEVEAGRRVDPTIVRLLNDGKGVTPEDRAFLETYRGLVAESFETAPSTEADVPPPDPQPEDKPPGEPVRTPSGALCRDILHPPKVIDPTWVEGRPCTAFCCARCRHADWDAQSPPGIAIRLAELMWARGTVEAERWDTGAHSVELELLEKKIATDFAAESRSIYITAAKRKAQIRVGKRRVFGRFKTLTPAPTKRPPS